MKAELVPENGDPPIPITRDVTIVGRRGSCDVVVGHPSLSKRHCVLVKTDGLLVIRDLATTNGTKVKGQRVRWAALLPDDQITLGNYKMRVYLGPDDVPGPSESHARRAATASAPRPSDSRIPPTGSPPGRSNSGATPVLGAGPLPLEDDEDANAGQESSWQGLIKPDDDDVLIELD
jgi:predicted component of type VI protein secretion system